MSKAKVQKSHTATHVRHDEQMGAEWHGIDGFLGHSKKYLKKFLTRKRRQRDKRLEREL